jgi:peroxiredoxin
MNARDPYAAPEAPRGLAVASVIVGLVAMLLSPFLIGALLAVVALPLAVLYLGGAREGRQVAWWGFGLSLAAIAASLTFGVTYYRIFKRIAEVSDRSDGSGGERHRRTASWVGTPAPALAVTTLDGRQIDLGQLKGRRVVLNFWATWCAACREEMPHLDRLARETDDSELTMVAISDEETTTLSAFAQRNRLQIPVASAARLPAPFDDLEAIPTTIYIDRNGIIQESAVGYQSYETLRRRALPGIDYAQQVQVR